ncbi:MAG: cytidylate kinase family protein [Candidatus Desulfatibia sp.]|uniref:cytidylate kinase-like family protein n=1 Tax=Candidatus Desulfatibia sp. TaxID=3101189 RepID=UPI002F3125DC
MTIIMISSQPHSGCEALAESLVNKTGWPSTSRKELVEKAQKHGIKVGRLELSMLKSREMHEKLAREKELYLSFITAEICELAPQGNLIYEGRMGHLLLPGVSHRLRVALVVPRETRAKNAMQALNLPQDKAMAYLDQLDEDIAKWARYVHRQDLSVLGQYDFVVNLYNMSMENASEILQSMAALPGFQPKAASLKAMADHHLTARAKLRLADDERTRKADVRVKADSGIITVTYMPQQQDFAGDIPKVLQDLEHCREVRCTMADTNILWIQEVFNPESENFEQINRLAQRWGAAVELLRLAPPEAAEHEAVQAFPAAAVPHEKKPTAEIYTGGIEDDDPLPAADDGGLSRTLEELVTRGRSGGGYTVYGSQHEILETVKGNHKSALVVIGDIFLSKGHETRQRQTRELALAVREQLKTPVITADELQARFLFGKRQAVKLLVFAILVACTYTLVFSFQRPILNFMGGEIHNNLKWLTSVVVFLFVPTLAYVYGTVTGLLLKLIGID